MCKKRFKGCLKDIFSDDLQREAASLIINRTVDIAAPPKYFFMTTNWLTCVWRKAASMTDQLSRVFAAMADPTRRDLVARLAVEDATVGELADAYPVSVQAVSKHLKVLESAGLVSRSGDSYRRPCHLEAEVFDLMTKWIERYRREAQQRFVRLDAVLAAMDDEQNSTPKPKRGRAS
jgi:DNA-binding transcriptional ArsR family regulator